MAHNVSSPQSLKDLKKNKITKALRCLGQVYMISSPLTKNF